MISLNQRDLVLVSFPLPQGDEDYFVVVLSNNHTLSLEHNNYFVGVMITDADSEDDDYSFDLEKDYFEEAALNATKFPCTKGSKVRVHLISSFLKSDVKSKSSRMKKVPFDDLKNTLFERVF